MIDNFISITKRLFSKKSFGRLRGWKDASFKVVTNKATTVSLLVRYVHVAPEQTKRYGEWNADR